MLDVAHDVPISRAAPGGRQIGWRTAGQSWRSRGAASARLPYAPGHPLGFDTYGMFAPIKVGEEEEGVGENLHNIGAIAVGGGDAADGSDDVSESSRFTG